jgi:hypothetical protein
VPVTGIGAIEHEEFHLALARLFHADAHRRFIGVKPSADVWNVEDERIDAFEHLIVRAGGFAVKAEDGKAGFFFDGVADFFVKLAEEAVLGGEDFDELTVFGVGEEIERASAVDGEAGLIGDEGDFLAVEELEVVASEDVDAAEDLGDALGICAPAC